MEVGRVQERDKNQKDYVYVRRVQLMAKVYWRNYIHTQKHL